MDDPADDLTVLDELVMRELTRSITTSGVVRLAADLWDQSGQFHSNGPVDLVSGIVIDLGARGLLTYRENDVFAGFGSTTADRAKSIYQHLPHTIRLTQKGWALMGYPTRHLEAGSIRAQKHHEEHYGDRTNYRRHSDTAEGGPVIRETFAAHLRLFPTHVHRWITEEDDMATETKRRYIRVTPEMEAIVTAERLKRPAAQLEELADDLELPLRTVKYILQELPRLRSLREDNGTSLKDRIVLTLEQMDVNNASDLRRILGRMDDLHNIVHVLHSLKSEGKVAFDEGRDREHPTKIRLTRRGEAHAEKYANERTAVEAIEDQAADDEIANPPTEIMQPVTFSTDPAMQRGLNGSAGNPYPLLHELIVREQNRVGVDAKQMAYLQAAEALKGIDDEAAAALIEKGAENDIPFPTPLEAEYLRFAYDMRKP